MDEYKQLRESLNKAPNPQQHEAQQAAGLEQLHKDEPAREEHHQDTESRVSVRVCSLSS